MELGVRRLNLNSVTAPIPEDGLDPYQMVQVHDYLGVSFLRMDPHVKAASKETIQTFSMAYPELLSHKFFVNVPLIMGWVFSAMKLFLAEATVRKFHPLSSGASLAGELKTISAALPSEYGGKGPSVKEGETVKLAAVAPAKAEDAAKTEAVKSDDVGKSEVVAAPVSESAETKAKEPAAPVEAPKEVVPEVKAEKVDDETKDKPKVEA